MYIKKRDLGLEVYPSQNKLELPMLDLESDKQSKKTAAKLENFLDDEEDEFLNYD